MNFGHKLLHSSKFNKFICFVKTALSVMLKSLSIYGVSKNGSTAAQSRDI